MEQVYRTDWVARAAERTAAHSRLKMQSSVRSDKTILRPGGGRSESQKESETAQWLGLINISETKDQY